MLKRQEGYILKHIDDKTYLLPYGQKIADCIVRLYGPAHVFSEKFAPFYLSSTTFSGCNDHREELPQTVYRNYFGRTTESSEWYNSSSQQRIDRLLLGRRISFIVSNSG